MCVANLKVKTFLACGMAEKAVETAVVLSQWNLAMELAQKHSLHNVAPVLLRYTGYETINYDHTNFLS